MLNKIAKFIIALTICEGAGLVGSIFTTPAIGGWYKTLIKPSFNPPNWLFAPVWTGLFFLMAIALYLVWTKNSATPINKKPALIIFGAQLLLNIVWSLWFFGLKSPLAGLIEIIFLWFAILLTIIYFAKIYKPATWLLAPYLVWVSFASFLNFYLWQLN